MTERDRMMLLKEWCRKHWRKHNTDGTVTPLGFSEFEELWRVWQASITWRHVPDQEADRLQSTRTGNDRVHSMRGRRLVSEAPLSSKTVEVVRGLHSRRNRVIQPMAHKRRGRRAIDWEWVALIGALALAGGALSLLGLRVLGVM